MPTPDVSALALQVLGATFVLSCLFGAIVQRTHFCTMGAVSDAVGLGDFTRLRQWALAIATAMAGFWLLVAAGQVDPSKTLYTTPRWFWLSALAGGAMFGFGMVLASGCASKNLVRLGGGSLKALVVIVVLGVCAFATLKGITAVVRVATVDSLAIDFAAPAAVWARLAGLFGTENRVTGVVLGLAMALGAAVWALRGPEFVRAGNLLAGIGIGACVAAMFWVTGHLGYVAEHPQTLEETFLATNSGRAEALSFVSPVAYTLDWLMFFSDRSKTLTVGIVSVAGVVVGAAAMAVAQGSFRWQGFAGVDDLAHHLVGSALMGVGGVTAMGCTIGQGISGIATLSLTSLVALPAIMAGAVIGVKYQLRRLERAA
jgi:uncharacterized membrane protein YedE/YeeE